MQCTLKAADVGGAGRSGKAGWFMPMQDSQGQGATPSGDACATGTHPCACQRTAAPCGAPQPPGRRAAYVPPALVALNLTHTCGDTGINVDGALGAYFTSGGGPA